MRFGKELFKPQVDMVVCRTEESSFIMSYISLAALLTRLADLSKDHHPS